MRKKPLEFSNMDLAISFLSKKLKIPVEKYKKRSALIKHFKNQKRISDWF